MAKYFGTANDIYSLKQAQKAQNAFINGSIKKTKLLISANKPFVDLPWAEIQQEQQEKLLTLDCKQRKKKRYEITGYENAHLYQQEKKIYSI